MTAQVDTTWILSKYIEKEAVKPYQTRNLLVKEPKSRSMSPSRHDELHHIQGNRPTFRENQSRMHIVILGNGIAGITAARMLRKRDSSVRISVISDEHPEFFSRTALMYIYMGHMRLRDTQPYSTSFWEKNRIARIQDRIHDWQVGEKTLIGREGSYTYDRLLLAVGSLPNRFDWPGQDLDRVHGLYHLQDLAAMEAATPAIKRAAIVGGGLIGIEMAEMFHSRGIPVTMLVREKSYWNGVLPPEESALINREIQDHGIDLRLSTELVAIEADSAGGAAAIKTNHGDRIACEYVGLTAGVRPNIDWLRKTPLEIDRGILVDPYLATSVPDVYAAGDCAQLREPLPGRRPIEAVWYIGRMMGETVAPNLLGEPTPYHPGTWYNSAKFFTVEYQVYGQVDAQLAPEHESLWWPHPAKRAGIRLVWDRKSGVLVGIHSLGFRLRSDVCIAWIEGATPVVEVVRDLNLANFDPEFAPTIQQELAHVFTQQTGWQVPAPPKRSLDRVLTFLKSR